MAQYYVDEAGDIKQMPDQRNTFQKILEGLGSAAGEWNNPGTYQKSLLNRNENLSSAMSRAGERLGQQSFTLGRDKTQNDFAAQMADKNNQFTLGRDQTLHGYNVEDQMRKNRWDESSAIDTRAHQTSERLGSQSFTSGQNELSRDAAVEAQLRNMGHDMGMAGINYGNTSALRAQAAADALALQRDQQAFTLPMQQAQIGFYGARGEALDRKPDPEAAVDIDKLPAMISQLDENTQKLLLAKIAELTALGKNLTYRDYELLTRTKPAGKGVNINTGGFLPTDEKVKALSNGNVDLR